MKKYDELEKKINNFFFDCKVFIWCESEQARNKSFDSWIKPEVDRFKAHIFFIEGTEEDNAPRAEELKKLIKTESLILRDMLYDLHFSRRIPSNAKKIYECEFTEPKIKMVDDRTQAPIVPEWEE